MWSGVRSLKDMALPYDGYQSVNVIKNHHNRSVFRNVFFNDKNYRIVCQFCSNLFWSLHFHKTKGNLFALVINISHALGQSYLFLVNLNVRNLFICNNYLIIATSLFLLEDNWQKYDPREKRKKICSTTDLARIFRSRKKNRFDFKYCGTALSNLVAIRHMWRMDMYL